MYIYWSHWYFNEFIVEKLVFKKSWTFFSTHELVEFVEILPLEGKGSPLVVNIMVADDLATQGSHNNDVDLIMM